ncbi:MAG: type I-E CRISPR-associated protein Cse1/CasA [Deltaproteobacteria bacterium]|nr:type I-E CRISPR-associated protein Cse1/CasA [Deltaproteobacteria bacterium]
MNVAFDPWIPVVTTSGKPDLASLCDVLTKGVQFVDLAVRPHERVSLMRLFLCVAHAALNGPKDYDEWCKVPERLPEAVQKYLTDWKDSFELFHKEKPWLQVPGLSKTVEGENLQAPTEDWTPISKLNFSFATGNNATFFDHSGLNKNRSIALSETLLSMLTFQCFSPGGLISQVYWNGKQSGKSSKDGPCVPASMIHAFLRGTDLLKTIHLNLPTHEDILINYGKRDFGKPVWEMMPTSTAASAMVENATATYVGRLVPMTRLIRIHPSCERMLLGDGLVYPSFTDGFPQEPTATVVIRQEERSILSYRPTKALWRELSAVVVKRNTEGSGGPLSLRAIQDGKGCDLIVAALARDKATIVDVVESVFHIPAPLRTDKGTASYESEVKIAESWANRLGWAIEGYRREIDVGWEGRLKGAGPGKWTLKSKLHSIATSHYWTAVEKNLQLLMSHIEAIGTDTAIPTRKVWRKILFFSACEAYRISCGQETSRHMRAFAKGWQKLTVTRDKPETDINKTTEVKV